MASLTPLSKGLIALAVLGGMASAVWHLGLKEKLSNPSAAQAPSVEVSPATPTLPQSAASEASTPPPAATTGAAAKLSVAENAETGRKLMDRGNYVQARVHLEAAVQGGDSGAACHLGEMTLKGQGGIAANQEQAAKLFQLAQTRGSICFASGQ